MKTKNSLNVGGLVGLILLLYIMYRVLLQGDILPLSISSVQSSMDRWDTHWHFLSVALLPVYVGIVFFGVMMGGLFFGSAMQRWLGRLFSKIPFLRILSIMFVRN